MTAQPTRPRQRRPRPKPGDLTVGDVRELMRRSYNRPLDPVPSLHQMARRRQTDNNKPKENQQ